MKAYLIDPDARSINEVDVDKSLGLEAYYRLLDCDMIEAAAFNEHGDVAYVDEEGLLKTQTKFFQIAGYPQPLAGKGLVVGTDQEGETVEPKTTLGWLKSNVIFLQRIGVRLVAA